MKKQQTSPASDDATWSAAFRAGLIVARRNANMTQAELAKATGLQPAAISHFECGQRQPSLGNLRKLCLVLKTSADFLLCPPNDKDLARRAVSVESTALLAVAPFTPDAYGGMKDADGDRVITCNDECPPCTLYKEKMIDVDAWFMCPECGRLGQRMEEASHRQVLTANVPGVAVASPTSTDPTP